MLMLIGFYIFLPLCISIISIHLMLMLIYINHRADTYYMNFNTSHVNVNRKTVLTLKELGY